MRHVHPDKLTPNARRIRERQRPTPYQRALLKEQGWTEQEVDALPNAAEASRILAEQQAGK